MCAWNNAEARTNAVTSHGWCVDSSPMQHGAAGPGLALRPVGWKRPSERCRGYGYLGVFGLVWVVCCCGLCLASLWRWLLWLISIGVAGKWIFFLAG